MTTFKKDKEYLIHIDDDPNQYRVICYKIIKDTKANIIEIHFSIDQELLKLKLEQISSVIEPIDNSEFFVMYTNWNNFYKSGFNQDLDYAYTVYKSILQSLNKRSIVFEGTGAFVSFDYNRLKFIIDSYKEDVPSNLKGLFNEYFN